MKKVLLRAMSLLCVACLATSNVWADEVALNCTAVDTPANTKALRGDCFYNAEAIPGQITSLQFSVGVPADEAPCFTIYGSDEAGVKGTAIETITLNDKASIDFSKYSFQFFYIENNNDGDVNFQCQINFIDANNQPSAVTCTVKQSTENTTELEIDEPDEIPLIIYTLTRKRIHKVVEDGLYIVTEKKHTNIRWLVAE